MPVIYKDLSNGAVVHSQEETEKETDSQEEEGGDGPRENFHRSQDPSADAGPEFAEGIQNVPAGQEGTNARERRNTGSRRSSPGD